MKIKLKIDLTNLAAVEALNTLLVVIGSTEEVTRKTPVLETKNPDVGITDTVEQKPVKTTKASKKTLQIVEDSKEETATEEVEDKKIMDQKAETPIATLEEIRELLSKKVVEHREEVKAKLTEFDAKNLTLLSEEHYDEFKEFLNSL